MTATRLLAAVLTAACGLPGAFAAPRLDKDLTPDSVEMKDGREYECLILKNSADALLVQTDRGEIELPKSQVRRIHDEMDGEIVYSNLTDKGKLPSWRSMVSDMREHDAIRSFEQIPATTIDKGRLERIPYLSFRVNSHSEFNVYGNPNDPVALEFGMYGKQKYSDKYKEIIREFLAGHLNTREEIAALYAISFKGGTKQVGDLVFEISPPKNADSYGGWWITVYEASRLNAARVSPAKYAAITRPFEEINNRDGSLKKKNLAADENWLMGTMTSLTGSIPKIRGFYRDKSGVFRLIGFNGES